MENVLSFAGLIIGVLCFFGCFERLGKVNWFHFKAATVLMYLSGTGWSLWVMKDALMGGLEWYQLLGGVFVLCLLWISRIRWKYGVPAEITRFPEAAVPEHFHRRKDD